MIVFILMSRKVEYDFRDYRVYEYFHGIFTEKKKVKEEAKKLFSKKKGSIVMIIPAAIDRETDTIPVTDCLFDGSEECTSSLQWKINNLY